MPRHQLVTFRCLVFFQFSQTPRLLAISTSLRRAVFQPAIAASSTIRRGLMDSASLLVCLYRPFQGPSDYARHPDPLLRLHSQSHQLRSSGRSLHVCLIRLHRGSTPNNHNHHNHNHHNHHNALHQWLPQPLGLCGSIHLHPWCGERQLHLLAVSLGLLWQSLRHVLWSVVALLISFWSDVRTCRY